MPEPDLSWMAVGQYIMVGPSEIDKYREAAERAGLVMRWEEAAPEWGADAMRGTRTA
jgi:hypothetical protein